MPKKCPPGVFCIENTTLLFLLIVFSIIGGVLYTINNNYKANYNIYMKNEPEHRSVLNDMHTPPLKNNEYHPELRTCHSKGLPINIKTRIINLTYIIKTIVTIKKFLVLQILHLIPG